MKYIYYIKNKINNKVYIGQTKDFTKRIKQHFSLSYIYGNDLHKDIEILKSINFETGILEQCEDNLASIKEKYWINFYKKHNFILYNKTKGGEGNRIVYNIEDKKIIDEYQKNHSVTFTAKILHISYKYCLKILKENKQLIYSNKESNKYRQGQKIKQLDKTTGQCIKIFPSIAEAASTVNGCSRNIWRAVNGERKTAYGYRWTKVS